MKRILLPLDRFLINAILGTTLISFIVGCTLPSLPKNKTPSPTPVSTAGYLQLGDDALFAGDYESAEDYYQDTLAIEPEHGGAFGRLAYVKAIHRSRI